VKVAEDGRAGGEAEGHVRRSLANKQKLLGFRLNSIEAITDSRGGQKRIP
jgi:hypothetical protein